MTKPKFHKLYFPGLISLVCLPLMCIGYLLINKAFNKYYAMTVVWTTKDEINRLSSRGGKKFDIETFRKYKTLKITGNLKNDSLELKNLPKLLIKLCSSNDTISGIKVSFGDHSQYAELIDALDICITQDKNEQFAIDPIGNNIFISHVAPFVPSQQYRPIFNDIVNYGTKDVPQQTLLEKSKSQLTSIYLISIKFWPSLLTFIMMLWFTVHKMKRYFKIFHVVNS